MYIKHILASFSDFVLYTLIVADRFSGPDRAIWSLCVCVCLYADSDF